MALIPRPLRRWLARWATALALLAAVAGKAAAERPPTTRLLPNTTVALLSVADAAEMNRWLIDAAIGQMSQDPELASLISYLNVSLAQAATAVQEQTGLPLPELLALPQGEVTLAVVAPRLAPSATVLLLELGGQLPAANTLLEHFDAEMVRSGVTKSEQTVADTRLTIYVGVGPEQGMVVYFVKDDTLVLGSDPEVLAGILAAWNGEQGRCLADNPDFEALMRRCRGPGNDRPQLTWYVDPVGAIRSTDRQDLALLAAATFQTTGFDGLDALGGSVALDAKRCDWLINAHLSLDSPRYGLVGAIGLRPGDTNPERWVPADVASYTTFHWDVGQSYAELAYLYDTLYGSGALSQLLEWLLLDPLEIGLEEQLLPAIDGRMTHITWIEQPATPQSQASLWALKVNDPGLFLKAIEGLSSLPGVEIARRTWAGRVYYELQLPRSGDLPADRQLLQPCFGVLSGYLLVADRASMYLKVARTLAEGSAALADDPEFKLVADEIRRQSGENGPAMIGFQRPGEVAKWLAELGISGQIEVDLEALGTSEDLLEALDSGDELLKALGADDELLKAFEAGQELLRQSGGAEELLKAFEATMGGNPLMPLGGLQPYQALRGTVVLDDQTGMHLTVFSVRQEAN